jgi:NADPH:quinone reductase-like Zn-dependent oxidoreductase
MRAIVQRAVGGPEVLSYEELPDPTPGPGQVLVRLRAAALNHRDVWIRKGQYAGVKTPIIPGSDGAGEVVAVGEGVDETYIGWHVVINPSFDWGNDPRVQGPHFRILGLPEDGTYAQFVCVPTSNIHAMPTGLSFEEAAAIPLAGLTAFRAVTTRAAVQADERVLVTGIGGGVAVFALQMARYAGGRVYASSSSEEKLVRASELGAEGGVNYTDSNWVKQIREMTDGGPDVIITSAGGTAFDQAIDACRPGGRVVVYGATGGTVHELQLRRIFWKQLSVLGSTMGTDAEFIEMLKWFSSGALTPVIDQVFPLEQAGAAQERMAHAEQFGKIVLAID